MWMLLLLNKQNKWFKYDFNKEQLPFQRLGQVPQLSVVSLQQPIKAELSR